MRQWHRWIGIIFAAFLLVIGTTGVAIQMLDGAANKASERQATASNVTASPDNAVMPSAGADHPDGVNAPRRPKMTGLRAWSRWAKAIHSGRMFGPLGTFLSLLCGVSLIFFSISGIWMYWNMFAQRRKVGRTSFFWKR